MSNISGSMTDGNSVRRARDLTGRQTRAGRDGDEFAPGGEAP
jgi:hypothetical protein